MSQRAADVERLQGQLSVKGRELDSFERSIINLIASDNAYPQKAASRPPYGGHMNQEGLLGERPFAGAELHDDIERIAIEAACLVFGAEHANVQPHSCSQANQAAYHALLKPGDPVLALDFQTGGHLTHGLKYNFSGRHFQFQFYGSGPDGRIDYDAAGSLANQVKPRLIICGSSSYPRLFDAERLRAIADAAGALLMFDLSHESGLIAGGVIPNPVSYADVVTMSLDKTLRGPFGGIILSKAGLKDRIDRAVHPGTQSSFPVRRISDAACSLLDSQGAQFREYAASVLENAKVLEKAFAPCHGSLVTGGTDKHYVVVDVRKAFSISGVEAEQRLQDLGILSNRQTLPTDSSKKMSESSGLRLGTAWATSRGYRTGDFCEICEIIVAALSGSAPSARREDLKLRVSALASKSRPHDVWAE